jgi:hypothetical protein
MSFDWRWGKTSIPTSTQGKNDLALPSCAARIMGAMTITIERDRRATAFGKLSSATVHLPPTKDPQITPIFGILARWNPASRVR